MWRTVVAGIRRGWKCGLAMLVAAGTLTVTVTMTVTAIANADSNAIQNGDFSAAVGGSGNDESIPDWPETLVTKNPTSCSWPGSCNGPFITVASAESCDPLQTGVPFLDEDVPDGSDAYVQQQVAVPSSGVLTFITWGDLDPATATISIVTNGNTVTPVSSFQPPLVQSGVGGSVCTGASPASEQISLAAYAGQTVGLRVEATSSGCCGAEVNFDDFSLPGGTSTTTSTSSTTTTSTTTTSSTTTTPQKRPSGTLVVCDLDFSTGVDTCGATVGDVSGEAPITPTGQVSFSSSSGGALLGTACELAQTPYSPGIASCTIPFRPADTTTFPEITATYQGDGTFAESSGTTMFADEPDDTTGQQTVCVESCSDSELDIPDTLDPDQTTVTVGAQCSASPSEETRLRGPSGIPCLSSFASFAAALEAVTSYNPDLVQPQVQTTAQTQAMARWTQLQAAANKIYGVQQEVTQNQATNAAANYQQWQDYLNGPNASPTTDAAKLQTTDTSLSPSYPPTSTSSSSVTSTDDDAAHITSAAGLSTGPLVSRVLASIYATHPTAADIQAFNQELALATAPVYSPARAVARLTLLVAVQLGGRAIAHDLGDKNLSQLARTKHLLLASKAVRVHKGTKTKITIAASPLGGRILRLLSVVGLSQKVTIDLTITERIHGTLHHVTRTIRVL